MWFGGGGVLHKGRLVCLRPQPVGGALEAQSVWQRGLSPPWLSWLPTPSACRCPPLEWRTQRGKAGPLSEAAAGCRSNGGGRATWAENQSGPGARGMSETRGPTPPDVGPNL